MASQNARTAPKGRPTPRRVEAVAPAAPRWRWWLEWLGVAVVIALFAIGLFVVVGPGEGGGGGGGHVPVVNHSG